MGRKDHKNLKKVKPFKIKKEPKYYVTDSYLNKMVDDRLTEYVQTMEEHCELQKIKAIRLITTLTAYRLSEKSVGWGKIRIERFLDDLTDELESILLDEVSVEDMETILKEEKKVDLDNYLLDTFKERTKELEEKYNKYRKV